ncbi:MAG: protein N-lysine methyltransferase family protein [Desulfobulbaceae bacterium]|nr:protein N-lysine methyltransferase family protein [Desulfobulbaceae bacterium]
MIKADELPGKAAEILKEIRKQYKVAFEPLTMQGKELQILQVTDIEPLLAGKDPFKETEDFPFWVKLWEASMVLAHTMATLPPRPGQNLLELGAGLAAPGLVAAAMGYQVTLSDYEPIILDFQRVSAAASGLKGVEFKIIDWKNPPALPPFDTIIGAEILFREEFFEPLLNIFDKLLAPGGTIYLAHDMRRKSLNPFLQLAEEKYEIAFSTRKLKSREESMTVVVNRLRRRV